MTIEQALKSYLLADATLVGLIGARLYPDDAVPQNLATWPALTYRQAGSNPTHYLTGGRSAVERDAFDLTAHSPNRTECAAVRDRLRDILSGTACRGVWGGVGGVTVRGGRFEDVFADAADPTDGDERRARTLRASLTVIWQR